MAAANCAGPQSQCFYRRRSALAEWREGQTGLEYNLIHMAKCDLIFFRHGLADWPDWPKPDDERPLTREGREITHRVATYLARLGVKPRKILTSPLPRASQTAEIVAEHLQAPIKVTRKLTKSFSLRKLEELLAGEAESIMLVGHEPNFSLVIKA